MYYNEIWRSVALLDNYNPRAFPVQVADGFQAPVVHRSNGTSCPTSGDSGGYTRVGIHYPPIRPILYESFDEIRTREDGRVVRHDAIDITCASGAYIVSVTDGIVPETIRYRDGRVLPGAGNSPRGGNYVWVRESSGLSHYYAHLKSLPLVRPGQHVSANQILGFCGRTGNAAGGCPHLHYAVETATGVAIDPYSKLLPLYQAGGWKRPGSRAAFFFLLGTLLGALSAEYGPKLLKSK